MDLYTYHACRGDSQIKMTMKYYELMKNKEANTPKLSRRYVIVLFGHHPRPAVITELVMAVNRLDQSDEQMT